MDGNLLGIFVGVVVVFFFKIYFCLFNVCVSMGSIFIKHLVRDSIELSWRVDSLEYEYVLYRILVKIILIEGIA